MSIILDALNKSEEERQRHLVPDLHTQQTPLRPVQMLPARQGSTAAARAALLIAAMALGLGLYAVSRQSELNGAKLSGAAVNGAADGAVRNTSGVSQLSVSRGDTADGAIQRHADSGISVPAARSANEPAPQAHATPPLVRPIPKVDQPGSLQSASSQTVVDEKTRAALVRPVNVSEEKTDQTRVSGYGAPADPVTVASSAPQAESAAAPATTGSSPGRTTAVPVPEAAGTTKPDAQARPPMPTLAARAVARRVETQAAADRDKVADGAPAAKEPQEGLKLSLSPELESLKRDLLALKRELSSPDAVTGSNASPSTRLPFAADTRPRLDLGQTYDTNDPAAQPDTDRNTKAVAGIARPGTQAPRRSLPAASSPANSATVSTAAFDPLLSPSLARQYPIAVHRYSEIPAERFIIIMGERYAEGDRLDAEWRVARISRAAVTLDNGKQQVKLAIR